MEPRPVNYTSVYETAISGQIGPPGGGSIEGIVNLVI